MTESTPVHRPSRSSLEIGFILTVVVTLLGLSFTATMAMTHPLLGEWGFLLS